MDIQAKSRLLNERPSGEKIEDKKKGWNLLPVHLHNVIGIRQTFQTLKEKSNKSKHTVFSRSKGYILELYFTMNVNEC